MLFLFQPKYSNAIHQYHIANKPAKSIFIHATIIYGKSVNLMYVINRDRGLVWHGLHSHYSVIFEKKIKK